MQWCYVQQRNVTTFLQNFMVPCRHPSILGTMKSWKYPDIHVAIILFNFHFMTYFVQTCFDISTMCCFYTWGPFFLWRNHQNYVYIYIYTYPNLPFTDYIPLRKETKFPRSGRMISGSLVQLFACVDVSVTSWVLKTTKKGWSFWMFFGSDFEGSGTKSRWRSLSFFYCKKTFRKFGKRLKILGFWQICFWNFTAFF